ncbi:unnamed protein product [Linum trigynum]|uniref:Uncharacterized protein n=1 Tax=Linum trigynum TaxID=586398 RepID=A0AAV2GA65_9ROSI
MGIFELSPNLSCFRTGCEYMFYGLLIHQIVTTVVVGSKLHLGSLHIGKHPFMSDKPEEKLDVVWTPPFPEEFSAVVRLSLMVFIHQIIGRLEVKASILFDSPNGGVLAKIRFGWLHPCNQRQPIRVNQSR